MLEVIRRSLLLSPSPFSICTLACVAIPPMLCTCFTVDLCLTYQNLSIINLPPLHSLPQDIHNWHTLLHSLTSSHSIQQHRCTYLSSSFRLLKKIGMAPKRESSIKKSPSPVDQPRLGPPYPCLHAAPKSAPEQKPRMLHLSDSPFDPSTLEVSCV